MKTAYGEVYWDAGRFVARHVVARPKVRRVIVMPWTSLPKAVEGDATAERAHRDKYEPLAKVRSRELGEYARKLRGRNFPVETITLVLTGLAEHRPDTKAHASAQQNANAVADTGRIVHPPPSKLRADITLREFGELLTSGKLYAMFTFPSRLTMGIRTRHGTALVLRKHVYPTFGNLPLAAFAPSAVDMVDEWFRALRTKVPRDTSANRIRDSFLALLSYAYMPARVLPAPVYPVEARRFLERGKPRKYELVRPMDDELLMALTEVPLVWRMYWGTLAREGARGGEWGSLKWTQIDFLHGVVSLNPNETKTDRDSDSWDLDPAVLAALEIYRDHYAPDSPYVFALDAYDRGARGPRSPAKHCGETTNIQMRFREHLRAALTKEDKRTQDSRARLFEPDANMRKTTRHHLRALFVMSSYCAGRSTEWICCRTGHASESTVAKYKARVKSWKAFGTLTPLTLAIPELRKRARSRTRRRLRAVPA